MSPVGLDYDGTIADTNQVKSDWIRTRLKMEVEPRQCDRTSCVPLIGLEAYEDMSGQVYERELSLQALPVTGVFGALEQLSQSRAVYVVTARLPSRVQFAREWLEAHGAARYVKAILSSASTSKEAVCLKHGIVALVDDDERHLAALRSEVLRPLLFKPGSGPTHSSSGGLQVYRSWQEVTAELI